MAKIDKFIQRQGTGFGKAVVAGLASLVLAGPMATNSGAQVQLADSFPTWYFKFRDADTGIETNIFNIGQKLEVDVYLDGNDYFPRTKTNSVRSVDYNFQFSDTSSLIPRQAIVRTNDFWGGKATGSGTVLHTNFNANGSIGQESIVLGGTNTAYGDNRISSYIFDMGELATNKLVQLSWVYPDSGMLTSHTSTRNGAGQIIDWYINGAPDFNNSTGINGQFLLNSGQTGVPEPQGFVLGLVGGAALALRNRRRYYSDVAGKLGFDRNGRCFGTKK